MRKQNIGFWLMTAGVCFLWNPPVGTLDILPDLLGFLLLYLGVLWFADLSDELAGAQRSFRSMLWVGLGELLAMLLTEVFLKNPTLELNRYERPVWILVFAFVFLVFEWYFLIPAWKRFFKGFSALADFHGGTGITAERRGKSLCERMTVLSAVFVISKTALTLLPELFVLTSFERDAENPRFTFDWYTYVEAFRVLATAISAVIGLIWLISMLRFLIKARCDRSWKARLCEVYAAEILPNKGFLIRRRMGTSFAFLRVGMILLINLSLLYYECLPDFLCVPLFLCGALLLGEAFGSYRPHAMISFLLVGVGGARTVLEILYLQKHIPLDALYQPAAYEQYLIVQLLGVAEVVLSLCLLLLLIRSMCRMAAEQASVVYEGNALLSAQATEKMHAGIYKKAKWAIAAAVLSAAFKVIQILVLQQGFEWIWALQLAASACAMVLFSNLLSEILDRVLEKYPSQNRV